MGQRIKGFYFVTRDPPQSALVNGSPPIKQERSGSSHGGVRIDSIYYYGKSVYQDVNLRSYFGSIRPPTRLTFGFRLGRCIILHFPKRTFIHFFLPRRPRRQKRREKSRPGKGKGQWWAFGKVGPIGCLHSSDGTEEERNKVRGRGAGKRVESIRLDDREKQNEIRIWPKKKQRYGYHDRSPSIKKNLSKSLRVSGAFKHPKYAGLVNDIALDDSFRKTKEIHRPRWDRRIDKGNRDDDRDHTEKQRNSVRVQLLFERSRSEGAEIARTECENYGKTSSNVFNQKIDYAPAEVSTRYGISGRCSRGCKPDGTRLGFGRYGTKSCRAGRLSYRAIEAARRARIGQFHRTMSGQFRINGKIWVRVLADLPITGKPTEVRMGRGKGNPTGWIARVPTGQIPFEMDDVSLSNARQAATLAAHKLCSSTKFSGRNVTSLFITRRQRADLKAEAALIFYLLNAK
ncbi:hypothetical protein L1987_88409 [Smallanthus sonchifolius]|nr:hypothetical protein L1987_88409 [Smallanthus sonchifolius]